MEALLNIQRQDINKLKQMFNNELNTLRAMVGPVSDMGERPLNMFATVIVATKIANDVLKLDLDISKMQGLIM